MCWCVDCQTNIEKQYETFCENHEIKVVFLYYTQKHSPLMLSTSDGIY